MKVYFTIIGIPAQDFMKEANENTNSRVREALEELAPDPVLFL